VADAPIGIFDSGFGGLTVARAVIDQLPHESVLYLGDTARQPYGAKPIGEVREYALECLDHLVDQGVKMLVIACNSASAATLRDARERYDVPVVEVILPATRRAVSATRNGRIGVICTRATAESQAYDDAFAAAPQITLTTQACPRFVEFVEQGVKMLVIACNSASAAMLRDARERYDVPVVEVILPATRRAVAATRTGRIGVICTRATAESQAYDDAFAAAPQITLTTRACPRFVEFVEQGVTGGEELLAVAHEYLDPLVAAGVDTLVLGCTHYPLLTGVISYVMGDDVTLVSSAEECAKDVYRVLTQRGLEHDTEIPPVHRFLTTGQPEEFGRIGQRFLGPELQSVAQFAGGGWVLAGEPAP
jgi:glutamate racemase